MVEAAKKGSNRENLGTVLLKPAAVVEGRGGPELTHHTKLELHLQATDLSLYVTL